MQELTAPLVEPRVVVLEQGTPVKRCTWSTAPNVWCTTASYQGTTDATLRSDLPFAVLRLGDLPALYISPTEISLLKWNLEGVLPLDAKILAVSIELAAQNFELPHNSTYRVRAGRRAWNESSVTYSSYDVAASKFDPEVATFAPRGGRAALLQSDRRLVDLVQRWHARPSENHGILLEAMTGTERVWLLSSESREEPRLTITYEVPLAEPSSP